MDKNAAARLGRAVVETLSAALLIVWVWIGGIGRWLIGSATGVLALVLMAYFYLRRAGPTHPFLPSEMLTWFAEQRYEIKLGIAGALLTTIGFAIAFWTASATWKRQKELELRIDASKAVQARFQRVMRALNAADSYLHVLINVLKGINPSMTEGQIAAQLAFPNSQAVVFAENRQKLYAAMFDVYDLYGEFAVIFANVLGAEADVRRAARAIEVAQGKLGDIVPPTADLNAPGFPQAFLSRCNLAALEAAHRECGHAREVASGVSGRAAGILISSVVRLNLIGLIHFTRMGRGLLKVLMLGRGKTSRTGGPHG